ncbi:hypothetical protein BT96DRAFT_274221 [Gymnopus androsaceus JB14]|uniref:Uncharacterized protein n=1 Tax=Gymnopus androsaceus JB14 TaxID=1447944 RepID=A0A6A4H5H9_9AGAR|nr:hypothetical protein BT96DRAFT_274221 [Gymnopus androsaceus JB14]
MNKWARLLYPRFCDVNCQWLQLAVFWRYIFLETVARTKDQRQRFNNYPHTSSPNPCFLSRPRPVPLHNTSKTCPRLMRLAFIITRTSRECEYDCLLV